MSSIIHSDCNRCSDGIQSGAMDRPADRDDDDANEDDIELVDVGGETSLSQMKLMRTAKTHFNGYMKFMNRKDPVEYVHSSYDSKILAIFFSKEYIGKFVDYMIKNKKIGKCQTMLNYISKIKIMLERDYTANTLPFLTAVDYYAKLRQSIATTYLAKCIKSGESFVTSAPPMTKEDLHIMCLNLIGRDSPSANEDRCLMVHQFQLMGRISEPGKAKKKDYSFVQQSNRTPIIVKLTRAKCSRIQELAMVVHYNSYAECSFHCFATLIAVNCDCSENLYPLILAAKNTSNYINRVLVNCFSDWKATQDIEELSEDGSSSVHSGSFLTPNLTSHSGRRGSAQEADLHRDVTTTLVGHRGGWTLDSINRIFCYITGNAKSDTACARALSNWPDANEGGLLPTLTCIDVNTRECFRRFTISLMSSSTNDLDERTRIALTISLLRHYSAFKNDFPNHSLISRISGCIVKINGLNEEIIEEWEKQIIRSFNNLNAIALNINELGEDILIPAN